MRIIIVGGGEVGFYLAQRLSLEKHELTVIEMDIDKCEKIRNALDIMVIEGNGASQEVLKEAGIDETDMIIGASGADEINIFACMIAAKYNVKLKAARVRSPEYYSSNSIFKPGELGVDLFIHPEEEVAEEILRLLMRATATEIIEFEKGKMLVVGIKLDKRCPYLNKQLKEMGTEELRKKFRVVAILKNNKTIIPTGEDYINNNDHLFVATRIEHLTDLLKMTGKEEQRLDKIMVLGGGKIGRSVVRGLEKKNKKVTLIEVNKEKSRKVACEFEKTMVVQADGTEIDLLAKEGILEMDAFVAVTSDDEKNIISCLLARHLGIQKTISLVNKIDYMPLMPVIGIDSTVNVRLSTANAILRLIRRGHILSVVSFHGIEAEGIEFEIKEKGKITDKPLSKIKLPEGSVIAFIVRDGESFVPHGNSVIKQGDRVIVFALPQAVPELERKFS